MLTTVGMIFPSAPNRYMSGLPLLCWMVNESDRRTVSSVEGMGTDVASSLTPKTVSSSSTPAGTAILTPRTTTVPPFSSSTSKVVGSLTSTRSGDSRVKFPWEEVTVRRTVYRPA